MQDPVFAIFCEEAKEHLGALEKDFLYLESVVVPEARQGQIDKLFRHAHSLKGDARAIGLAALQHSAQRLEDILDGLRLAPDKVNRDVINEGLAQVDAVRHAFETWQRALADEKPAEPASFSPGVESSRAPDRQIEAETARSPRPAEETAPVLPMPDESFTVRVPSERLDRMLNLAGEIRIVQRSGEELSRRLGDLNRYLSGVLDQCQQLAQSSVQERERAEIQAELAGVHPQMEGCRDQVGRIVSALRKKRNREDVLMEMLETDIQQARLLPLTMLADSLRRVVRDLAQGLGKPMRYEVDVGSVLLDKAILEALRDPMLHLLRNAASHGIEAPVERRAAGKTAEGTIRLEAARLGNAVRILVSDDGRGVDFNRVRARLRQTEDIGEAELAALTEEDLAGYLFKPGFTTAVSQDAISGRGVGLDVVLSTVHRLHGSVVLESSSPRGTIFAITVPVSISAIRILTVLCEGQYFGIPSTLIEKTGRAKVSELRDLEGCPILPLDGEPVRWVALKALLGAPPQARAADGPLHYVLIRRGGQRIAVAVDDLEEEGEVLLKPLGFPLHDLTGIVGAAVRPDGSVQIVLDLSSASLKSAGASVATPREARSSGSILVVDDSPTTRTILRNVFTAAGYSIRTATDGVDALERLRSERVDLVVSDVEMPRMDGLELTRQIKARYRLPVILVTGLEKEEVRRKGLEAGADAYVVKSAFQGESLLEIVKQFV
ncbi:MAG TPA: response regulator [Gemmataceae bacterium]|jgi:two-component system chemotaxis sensor kinase CheA|nr:response regulator [Gemmataceae bacterium]